MKNAYSSAVLHTTVTGHGIFGRAQRVLAVLKILSRGSSELIRQEVLYIVNVMTLASLLACPASFAAFPVAIYMTDTETTPLYCLILFVLLCVLTMCA